MKDWTAAKILIDYIESEFTKENTKDIPNPEKLFRPTGKEDGLLSDITCK